jgi:membrane protein required for colicin V production
MTWLDIIITVVFLVFAVLGLMRGLVAEVFSLLSWVVALYVGSHYGELARPYVESFITNAKYQGLVACVLVGIVTFIVVALIGILLSKKINATLFAPINRMLGMLFGAARGAIVVGFVTLIALQFGIEDDEVWKSSKLRGAATTSAELLDSLVDFEALLRNQSIVGRPSAPT